MQLPWLMLVSQNLATSFHCQLKQTKHFPHCPLKTYRIATEDEAQHKGRVGQGDSHSHAFGPNITDAKWYETQVRHQKTELEAEKA